MTKQTYSKRRKTNKLRKLTKKVGGGWWPFGKSKSQKRTEFRSKFLDLLIADYITTNNPNYYDTILNPTLLAEFKKSLPVSKKYMKQFLETKVESGIKSNKTEDKDYAYSFLRDMIKQLNNKIIAFKKETPSQKLISNYTFGSSQVFYDITHKYYETLKAKGNLTPDEKQYINYFDTLTNSSKV
jgi:hypothetical protein